MVQNKAYRISSAQLIIVLFLSRFFTLMTYQPTQQAVGGSTVLLTIPLSALAAVAVMLPFLWLYQKAQADPLTCAFRVSQSYGVVSSIILGLFCLFMTAYSVSHFQFFMVSTVYPQEQPWIFIVSMLAVAAYGAKMGLEALSRMGVLVFWALIAVTALLLVALIPNVRSVYLTNPLFEGYRAITAGTFGALANNAELVLFMLLLSRTKEKGGKVLSQWLILVTIWFVLFSFLTLTVLGDYVKARIFPVYSLTSVAQFSFFGRMDLLHIFLWIFIAFVRVTLYLYCTNLCLRRIFPKLSRGWGITICTVLLIGLASLLSSQLSLFDMAGRLLMTGIPLGLAVVVFPLLTLLFPSAKGVSQKSLKLGKKEN